MVIAENPAEKRGRWRILPSGPDPDGIDEIDVRIEFLWCDIPKINRQGGIVRCECAGCKTPVPPLDVAGVASTPMDIDRGLFAHVCNGCIISRGVGALVDLGSVLVVKHP